MKAEATEYRPVSERVLETARRRGPSRAGTVTALVAVLAAAVYAVVFSAGLLFLAGAVTLIAVLSVAVPYVRSLLDR